MAWQREIGRRRKRLGGRRCRHRLDRLGRSLRDLANIAHEIDLTGAHLKVIEQNVDTATSAGRAFFGMLAVFAQFETDARRERQAEGIARRRGAERNRSCPRAASHGAW